MDKNSLHVKIVSPERTLFEGEVESITMPGALGEFEVFDQPRTTYFLFIKRNRNVLWRRNETVQRIRWLCRSKSQRRYALRRDFQMIC